MRRRSVCVAFLMSLAARASGLEDRGLDLWPREKMEVKVSGYLRVRGDLLNNLDLDRGLTPSGQPLFAVPLSDPNAQTLTSADMRLRTDLAVYTPWASAAVKMRVDVLDDLVLGSTPVLSPGSGTAPTPAATPGQLPSSLIRIKRLYGEALTPIGFLSAGRMGNQWGLGMFANGGDCLDCNLGDSTDRIAFVTALAKHLWAIAHDFSAVGPTTRRRDGQRSLILDPAVDVRSVTFAVMNVRDDTARLRRTRAGKVTVEYGAFGSYRWQDFDLPQSYLPTTQAVAVSPAAVMQRGYKAVAFDAWARVTTPVFQAGLEGALLLGEVAQTSLLPGVLLRDRAYATQAGLALETQFGRFDSPVVGGLNAGIASGDPAPGFGAYPGTRTTQTPGELDGPQALVPRDNRIDNFRFHPDYRVDRITFAEIVGTVTDSMYVRPWVRARLWEFRSSTLSMRAAGTFSRAVFASSTPGGDANLGVELHGSLTWEAKDGFNALVEYACLLPFAGLSNPVSGLTAQPAQLARLRLAWIF